MSLRTRQSSIFIRAIVPLCLLWLAATGARAQEQRWITQFGTSGSEFTYALASDGAGGVMVAGHTLGDLGGTNAGSFDVFLARYDSAGNQLWLRQFGSSEYDKAQALAADDVGGVFIAGTTGGDLGGTGTGRSYIARYDSVGNRLWLTQFGGSAWALAPDKAGGVFVTGSVSVGGRHRDVFLTHYDGDGNRLWNRQFGTIEEDFGWAVAPDGTGGVIVAGQTDGSMGGANMGNYDAFLARYDSAGNQVWIRQFGTPGDDTANALAPNSAGGVSVAGQTRGSLGGPNAGGVYADAFVARYDSDGSQVWVRQFGTPEFERALSLASDGAGGVMVTGETKGSLGGPSAGGSDAFLARYDGNGHEVWTRQFGTIENDLPYALSFDAARGVMVAGETRGGLGGPNAGNADVFLAGYSIDSCYADCDQFTGAGVLDIFDFLCFQNSFVNAEPYACDCDTSTGPGVCDIFDFLCFQDAFVGGCP